MPRKPKGPGRTRQVQFRAPEPFRRQLEKAAIDNKVSLNREMLNRLGMSFEQADLRSLAEVSEEAKKAWHRHWGKAFADINRQGDLIRAAEKLLAALEADSTIMTDGPSSILTAIADVRNVIRLIELSAANMLREAHTASQRP